MMFGYKAASNSNCDFSLKEGLNNLSNSSTSLDGPMNKSVQFSLSGVHPLELKDKNYLSTKHQMNMNMLRSVQGIHAPLRISMELRASQNVGRLPFLSSSHLSSDIIMGRDDRIDFSDILYPADMHEQLNRPHVAMERF